MKYCSQGFDKLRYLIRNKEAIFINIPAMMQRLKDINALDQEDKTGFYTPSITLLKLLSLKACK